ncbi:MAG TPA: hypothetical protein VFS20_24205 [Longimicrobium sp.]|nr:hypothetical protein [Longimicrobium sp.]
MRMLAAVLLLATACAPGASGSGTASPPPAAPATAAASPSLVGGYALRQVNGRDLPQPSPQEPNVELTRGWVQLNEDGTFAITLTGRRNQEPTPGDQQMRGNYVVSGSTISFNPPGGTEGQRFGFSLAGATLTLRDDAGHTFTLQRQ